MNPIHSLRAAAIVLASLAACSGASAQDASFCPALKRVMAEKPKGFAWLKVRPYHSETKEWDTRLKLPGTQFCRVDLERKNFNCWITGLSKTWTLDGAAKLKTQITTCLGDPSAPEKTDELPDTSRTMVGWQSEGANIQLITRIGKTKNSVFVYVQ